MSDKSSSKSSDALKSASGRDYPEWYALLDEWGAPGRPYREIADWLTGQGMSDWWAQKVIVEYEQARGIRKPGARQDGTFSGGASKTLAVSARTAFDAVTKAEVRRRWLPEPELTERTSNPTRSVRFDAADGTRVNVTIDADGDAKCRVAVEQTHLLDADVANDARAQWRDRLTALKALIEG
ncbi:hypothetical protein [Streptomyces sp. KR80]|uniref:hypothetical protein n=1 Tax=Streptomyces sp. KR80 TaxID=3457426 RepID=UPI003FD43134